MFTAKTQELYLFNTYTIYFLKKERIYTKLKYSRVPQFDVASGGIATLFAALYGFLVTEKFGFEMIDSGDFYLIFMYVIFISLTIRTLFKLFDANTNTNNVFSLNNIMLFYWLLFSLFAHYVRFFFKKNKMFSEM